MAPNGGRPIGRLASARDGAEYQFMATKRMLVDAIHPEETRIVVTNGNRLEEFDFESATRRQLRGNIYLAKVTRVEPSLQAAFVEYGGNRHGFLAFSEIHPDYYQIPVADREALLREEAAAQAEHDHEHADNGADHEDHAAAESEADAQPAEPDENGGDSQVEQVSTGHEPVESVGGADALEDAHVRRARPMNLRRQYKIQEVIKRRQVMLVQVVKEERGNKGAALTTYLSLAGRYSVLMPNTARGGGISRKITSAADRKRLKEIVGDLDVPTGQGVILRTAGASRTKAEVKRDFEYLQRLWENVRTLTLKSTAPCLVYEEGSLIKRTIRDLYSKEIDELLVAGDDAYREAKDFMRMIMPSHAKNVQVYREDQPIFSRFGVEGQLDQMFSPQVTLPSGGYLVINPTEALVSIDVNSGRATKEHNIEDTALQTNLEAAEEISRQLRLRDLAGLIVIDFIDMMENRSNRAVERKLKECLKNDRARIQVGRISHFGLMEMSRQRIRFGVVESSTHKCPTCNGTGLVRSVESVALMVMRAVEDHVLRKPGQSINVRMPTDVALYVLNTKRVTLNGLEQKYDLSITVAADDHVGASHYAIERGENRIAERSEAAGTHVRVDTAMPETAVEDDDVEDEVDEDDEAETTEASAAAAREDSGERNGRRRRRRRRGGDRPDRNDRPAPAAVAAEAAPAAEEAEGDEEPEGSEADAAHDENGDEPRRRRRRGRRGGRRNRRADEAGELAAGEATSGEQQAADSADEPSPALAEAAVTQPAEAAAADAPPETIAEAAPEAPAEPAEKPKRTRRRKAAAADEIEAAAEAAPAPPAEPEAEAPKPKRTRRRKTDALPEAAVVEAPAETAVAEAPAETAAAEAPPAVTAAPNGAAPAEEAAPEETGRRRTKKAIPEGDIVVSSTAEAATEEKPKKAGWWQRRLGLGG
jgi:ribonuclease E